MKNVRFPERLIDEQIGSYVDRWVNNNILVAVERQVKKLCKDDAAERLLVKLNNSGLIGDSYTSDSIRDLHQTKSDRTNKINQIAKRIRKWGAMTNTERKKFIVNNIERIYFDVSAGKVKKVVFLKVDPR